MESSHLPPLRPKRFSCSTWPCILHWKEGSHTFSIWTDYFQKSRRESPLSMNLNLAFMSKGLRRSKLWLNHVLTPSVLEIHTNTRSWSFTSSLPVPLSSSSKYFRWHHCGPRVSEKGLCTIILQLILGTAICLVCQTTRRGDNGFDSLNLATISELVLKSVKRFESNVSTKALMFFLFSKVFWLNLLSLHFPLAPSPFSRTKSIHDFVLQVPSSLQKTESLSLLGTFLYL